MKPPDLNAENGVFSSMLLESRGAKPCPEP